MADLYLQYAGVIKRRRRNCKCCGELFWPDHRNVRHQSFCSKEACQQASKVQSQRRWLSKSENRDHFRGPANIERVRQWRKANPGYWKKPSGKGPSTLQEDLLTQAAAVQEVDSGLTAGPLQDLLSRQDPVVVGLISHLIDSTLQENIEATTRRLLAKGRDILDMRFGMKRKEEHENQKTDSLSGTAAAGSRTVQLDRPTRGP